ncbi:hypothetical protein [Pseudomonas sp. REB1044]|uniref:hypothetical protein n=1 Tax=Pseudomonas sp. REB1044 TaxID=2675224 RepID=UPI00315CC989
MPNFHTDPALWLETFKVELTSASANLYGNGRQQSQIRLTVELQTGQPPLTEAQQKSLKLVLERDDGTYEPLPFEGANALLWAQTSVKDERYDLMPGSGTQAPIAPDTARAFSKVMYVTTRAAGGANAKLRAMIQKDERTTYYTDNESGFDSYVILSTITPPTFSEGDYVWVRSYERGNINNVFLHEYKLQLKGLGLSSPTQTIAPGMIRWQRNEPSETYATYVGMAYPGTDKTVHYESAIKTGNTFVPARQANTPGNDALVLVLNGADNINFYSDGLDYGGPCSVKVTDRHGNEHILSFAFASEGSDLERRSKIVVSYS